MQTREEYNAYQRVYQLERYHRRRREAIEFLGGRCVICGTTEDLEIDHIDYMEKKFNIAKLWSISYVRFMEEISKCQLLCVEHHKHKSSRESIERRGLTHGKYHAAFHYDCQCEECIEFRIIYTYEYNEERNQIRRERRAAKKNK